MISDEAMFKYPAYLIDDLPQSLKIVDPLVNQHLYSACEVLEFISRRKSSQTSDHNESKVNYLNLKEDRKQKVKLLLKVNEISKNRKNLTANKVLTSRTEPSRINPSHAVVLHSLHANSRISKRFVHVRRQVPTDHSRIIRAHFFSKAEYEIKRKLNIHRGFIIDDGLGPNHAPLPILEQTDNPNDGPSFNVETVLNRRHEEKILETTIGQKNLLTIIKFIRFHQICYKVLSNHRIQNWFLTQGKNPELNINKLITCQSIFRRDLARRQLTRKRSALGIISRLLSRNIERIRMRRRTRGSTLLQYFLRRVKLFSSARNISRAVRLIQRTVRTFLRCTTVRSQTLLRQWVNRASESKPLFLVQATVGSAMYRSRVVVIRDTLRNYRKDFWAKLLAVLKGQTLAFQPVNRQHVRKFLENANPIKYPKSPRSVRADDTSWSAVMSAMAAARSDTSGSGRSGESRNPVTAAVLNANPRITMISPRNSIRNSFIRAPEPVSTPHHNVAKDEEYTLQKYATEQPGPNNGITLRKEGDPVGKVTAPMEPSQPRQSSISYRTRKLSDLIVSTSSFISDPHRAPLTSRRSRSISFSYMNDGDVHSDHYDVVNSIENINQAEIPQIIIADSNKGSLRAVITMIIYTSPDFQSELDVLLTAIKLPEKSKEKATSKDSKPNDKGSRLKQDLKPNERESLRREFRTSSQISRRSVSSRLTGITALTGSDVGKENGTREDYLAKSVHNDKLVLERDIEDYLDGMRVIFPDKTYPQLNVFLHSAKRKKIVTQKNARNIINS